MIPLMRHPFHRPEEMKRRLCQFIETADRFTCGVQVARFEQEFAEWQGRRHAVCFNSGSSANLALIQTMLNLGKLAPGYSVGYSALTWATNVMPLLQLGLGPVPVDIARHSFNVDVEQLDEAYQAQPFAALFLTHALGLCNDMLAIRGWCESHGVHLLEDACEAFGSENSGRKLGNWGWASTFSFYVGHHLSTIEGGMVATDDDAVADVLRMVRSHGWARDLPEEKRRALFEASETDSWHERYAFFCNGYNLRPTELTGVLGCAQMEIADEVVEGRERNFLKLAEAAAENPHIEPIQTSLRMDRTSAFAFPVVGATDAAFCDLRERLGAVAEIRPIIGGAMPEQPFQRKSPRYRLCPNALAVHQRGLYFACRHDLEDEEIETLCSVLRG